MTDQDPILAAIPVTGLGLTGLQASALRKAGYETADSVAQATDEALLAVRGIAEKSLSQARQAVARARAEALTERSGVVGDFSPLPPPPIAPEQPAPPAGEADASPAAPAGGFVAAPSPPQNILPGDLVWYTTSQGREVQARVGAVHFGGPVVDLWAMTGPPGSRQTRVRNVSYHPDLSQAMTWRVPA